MIGRGNHQEKAHRITGQTWRNWDPGIGREEKEHH